MRSRTRCEWLFLRISWGRTARRSARTLFILNDTPIPKSTLSQHFKILREAGLIRGERRGVEMHNVSRCAEVDQHYPGLISTIVQAHTLQLAREAQAKKKPAKKKAK